jgi:signal recognition particle subunit SRP54
LDEADFVFDALTDRLGGIFDRLTRRGALSESDVAEALREVRVALLEADVALPVVRDFIDEVQKRAVGEQVLRSVTPGQMVVKVVYDRLVEMLSTGDPALNLGGNPPIAILMVGLQGSGKTTSSAKIARRLTQTDKKKVMMASLDVYRPAAQQQLAVLGKQVEVATLPAILGEQPLAIARRAMATARREGYDVVILDSAGRLHIDDTLMAEVTAVSQETKPQETLLVADAMTGQDAVNVAREFKQKVGVTGLVLTRVDGDARGGAALSMSQVAGVPVKLMGTGEKLDALEVFQPERIAGRILGMGDVVGLVEKAQEAVQKEDAEKIAKKMMKGEFSLDDLAEQLRQIRKMGDMKGLLGMLPGIGKVKDQIAKANIDDRTVARQEAIILAMTKAERRNPKLLNGSRRRRIAAGSGTSVPDVNRLLKQHLQMSDMMKKMGKLGKRGLAGLGKLPGFPGMPGR